MPNLPLTVPSPYFKQRKTKGASDRRTKNKIKGERKESDNQNGRGDVNCWGLSGWITKKEHFHYSEFRALLHFWSVIKNQKLPFPTKSWSPSGETPPTGQKPRDLEVRPGDMPKVLIIVITIVGTALLVLNVALIACFVRRRHRKRLAKGLLLILDDNTQN